MCLLGPQFFHLFIHYTKVFLNNFIYSVMSLRISVGTVEFVEEKNKRAENDEMQCDPSIQV